MTEKRFALIIPAAGSGSRLGNSIPKPYLEIAGAAILEHTLNRFSQFSNLQEVIVATSAGYKDQTFEILNRVFPEIITQVAKGGTERQDSIRNALDKISADVDLVAVHDAVRPFISPEVISECLERAAADGGAIVGVHAKDTIKISNRKGRIVSTPDRSNLWQAQTPQIFQIDIIRKAYRNAAEKNLSGTDDSSLVEQVGGQVTLIEGSRENFKITYPLDLQLAELLLNDKRGL